MTTRILVLIVLLAFASCRSVTFDGRALIIDDHRKLILSGSVHYPRSTPSMWPQIFQHSKDAGLDAIETYVFWNGHEQTEGNFNFAEQYDIVKFVKEAANKGLYVIVRIGPYVCAEWDYGGLPAWLKFKPSITFRTYNAAFMMAMKKWTEKVVELFKENNLMYPQGGPIIALQIENEYGNVESEYGENGKKYVQWAAQMALDTNAGIPWIMCAQDDAPINVINTCNGFYCDNWIADHHKKFPNQPAMFTENWPGWFQGWNGYKPVRPVEDVAFSVLRWVAKGGALMNYYMFHGGSNFGRTSGPMLTTSYDYDAPIDEYGLPNNPKYSHLQQMHKVLHKYESLIINNNIAETRELATKVEAHIYGDLGSKDCVAFISNWNEKLEMTVTFNGAKYKIPGWSVSILSECKDVVFNSAAITGSIPKKLDFVMKNMELLTDSDAKKGWISEKIASAVPPVMFKTPREQLSMTKDLTDYLWYTTMYNAKDAGVCVLELDKAYDIQHIFVNEQYMGSKSKIELKLSAGRNRIDILSVAMGLANYGTYLEKIEKGLIGNIHLCGENIHGNTWAHVPGLKGENDKYYIPEIAKTLTWNEKIEDSVKKPLVWIMLKLNIHKSSNPVALDLAEMGKGFAWVNGKNIGRYYSVKASGSCKFCDFHGAFKTDKCCEETGPLSQRYYHVPNDWLLDGENTVILFEEIGGDARKVNFVERDFNSICGLVYEIYPLENSEMVLSCPEGYKISEIQFASFGIPTGGCGHYEIGSCHSSNSLEVVKSKCLGKTTCAVQASVSQFGDPCKDYAKKLVAQAKCEKISLSS